MLGACVADIGFRRPEAAPISSNFHTLSIDREQFMIEAADTRLGQQALQHPFRLFVGALTKVMIAYLPLPCWLWHGRHLCVS